MNILFTCAGRRNILLQYFQQVVHPQGGQVFAADVDFAAPALQEADRAFIVNSIDHPDYLDQLLELCQLHQIRLVLSLNDLEIPLLARQRGRFREVGTTIVVSAPRVVDICFDKWQTYCFLKRHRLGSPKTYLSLEAAQQGLACGEITFPLVIKPRWGTASIGIEYVEDNEDLVIAYRLVKKRLMRSILANVSMTESDRPILIQEKIEGPEYGLDVINDLNEEFVTTIVKRKLGMRAGETDQAVTIESPQLEKLGKQIGQQLGHIGNLDCDVFVHKEKAYVLEMNPRFGGGYPFSHIAGANLPAMLVAWVNGQKIKVKWLNVTPNITASKYDVLACVKEPHGSDT